MKEETKGNVILENIRVGDTHYEYAYGMCIKSKVTTLPVNENGVWTWDSKNIETGTNIKYAINTKYPSFYSIDLYDYEAYRI